MAISGDNIYVGGEFISVGATTRSRLAAVNTSGSLLSWDPNASSTVRALTAIGDNVYIGGLFTTISSQTRRFLAALNSSGALLSWNPEPNNTVNAITSSGGNVYIGGNFTDLQSNITTTSSKLSVIPTYGRFVENKAINAYSLQGASSIVVMDRTVVLPLGAPPSPIGYVIEPSTGKILNG
jgi:hypothetical protein